MEFDNSRLYTCVNATELHIGDKVYVGNDLAFIKDWWRHNCHTDVLTEIRTDGWERRFGVEREGEIEYFALAYLMERAENCTNCGNGRWDAEHQKILCDPVNCGNGNVVFRNHEIEVCEYYKPIAKMPKTKKEDNMWNYESLPERQENGVSDHIIVAVEGCPYGQSGYYDFDLQAWFIDTSRYPVPVYAWKAIKPPRMKA